MKVLLALAVFLAVASCNTDYYLNVGNQCSTNSCARSYWDQLNMKMSFTCPESGKSQARLLINEEEEVFLHLAAQNPKSSDNEVFLSLNFNLDSFTNGVMFYSNLQPDHTFVILSCSNPAAKEQTQLCSKHLLVAGKIYKGVFQKACAFSLDAPSQAFLEQEQPKLFESII